VCCSVVHTGRAEMAGGRREEFVVGIVGSPTRVPRVRHDLPDRGGWFSGLPRRGSRRQLAGKQAYTEAMTDAELEAERAALLAEEQALEAAHARLHQRPDDRLGHQAHRERLKAHTERVRAFQDALQAGTAPQSQTVPQPFPTCPVCRSEAVVPSGEGPRVYRCLGCRTEWVVASPQPKRD
jgi:hypothetical protein